MSRPLLIAIALVLPLCAAQAAIRAEKDDDNIPPLHPPRGMMQEVTKEPDRWPWYVAAGLLAVSAVLMWPRAEATSTPKETPRARAARELRDLRHPDAITLGGILREYFLTTIPGALPGQTFPEIAAALDKDLRWTPGLRARFRKLADPIELAKFSPEGSTAAFDQLRDEALELITEVDALNRPPVPEINAKP